MIIYTCITDGYDKIPLNNYYDPDVKYVCFYDQEIEKTGPWKFIKISNEIECPFVRAHYYKILPYNFFDINEKLIWIDACRVHTKKLIKTSKRIFKQNIPLSFLFQQSPTTFLESVEFDYFKRGHISPSEIVSYCEILKKYGWSFKRPPINNFIVWMNGIDKSFCDLWWELFLKGPKRDIISMMASLELCDIKYAKIVNYFDDIISEKEKIYKGNRIKDYYWKNHYTEIEIKKTIEHLKVLCL